jgi:hypothetical protein
VSVEPVFGTREKGEKRGEGFYYYPPNLDVTHGYHLGKACW